MSLTRYLPTPSDRMGILWTLLQIEDAIILEYGTAGTTAYAMKTLGIMDFSIRNKLFTTGMDENNIVMGDTAKLEEKIKYLDNTYSPKVIFVMASSVSSVTGADVKGICNYLQEDVNAKIITFTQGGWGGDFSSGIEVCLTDLVTHLATDVLPVGNYYNLLGASATSEHARNNTREIAEVMQAKHGLQANAVLSLNTNLEQIATMSKARLNLVISYEGLKAAELLKERFGTPYEYGFPLSSIQIPATNFHKIAVYASYDELLAYKSLAIERGLEIEFLLCTHKIHKIKNCPADILYLKDEKSKIELFRNLEDTLVLGDSITKGTVT